MLHDRIKVGRIVKIAILKDVVLATKLALAGMPQLFYLP